MHIGNLVFSQLMEFAPWHTFRRLVAKYRGDFNVRTFSCLDQFLSMAFAQLTYRESLRDIEACLRAHSSKLYHMGLRGTVSRSVLADANERREWRIYAEFAQGLIRTAHRLYAQDCLAVNLAETVYALDATTIDLCLSVFPWAPFRSTKTATKLHTLLDLSGNIPTFLFISDGKLYEVNIWFSYCPSRGPSMSWIAATSTATAWVDSAKQAASLSLGPSPISKSSVATPTKSTKTPD